MEGNEELPEIQKKTINGVEITNLDLAKISMICDYLVVDRFHDISSFVRFEKCFGLFFLKESSEFLQEVFREICGEKKKYITFGRLILAYIKWISKSSTNENFYKFMDLVFGDMIKTQNEVIGKLVEGGRVFSTRNTRGRKVISRFSVLTDPSKNQLEGFQIQYDDFFDTVLSPNKNRDNITLEMNFLPESRNIRDRDGISHIGGKYSITKSFIKFLIFKCRSGKTFYIGDETEEDGEEFEFFLFGTSSCQLKSLRIELVNGQLIYFEPKFQPSLRLNQKIIDFNSLDEKFINECIINAPLIFEENEIQNLSIEELIQTNSLLIPCVSDDAFIDKKLLEEPLSGKDFNEIYKTFLVLQSEQLEAEKEELKKKIYEKTIMRKKLLKIYFNKFKIQENILVLKTKKPAECRVNMDKFLCKIKAFNKKINKKKEEPKKQLEIIVEEEEGIWDDEEDWVEDANLENNENNIEEQQEQQEKEEEEINIEENKSKEENKIVEPPKVENEINLQENKIEEIGVLEPENEKEKLEPQEEGIKLKLNRPKKLLKKSQKKPENEQDEIKKEEIKLEEPKKEEIIIEEPKKEEINMEQPKKEENIIIEQTKEENKIEEIKRDENEIIESKNDIKKEDKKDINKNENTINIEHNNNNLKEQNAQNDEIEKVKKDEPKKKKKFLFCDCF